MIYFPMDEAQPRFLWIRINEGHGHPSLKELAYYNIEISHSEDCAGVKPMGANFVLSRPLEPHLIMFSPPTAAKFCPCCKDKYEANKSFLTIDAELADTLRGPILAWAMHVQDHIAKKSHPIDLAPMYFCCMVDELRLYYNEVTESFYKFAIEKKDGKGIKGVRLNCKGDRQILNKLHIPSVFMSQSALRDQSQFPTQWLIDPAYLASCLEPRQPQPGVIAN
jgi:hypothetical protein